MIKRIIITLITVLVLTTNSFALELLVKIGDKYPEGHPNHESGWRHGQIVDIRPSGFHGNAVGSNLVIDFPNIEYWTLRGDTDWKSTKASVMELKKYISKADASGKYIWEIGFDDKTTLNKKRDGFIDFQDLENKSQITATQHNSIKAKEKPTTPISFSDLSISSKLKNERTDTRLSVE